MRDRLEFYRSILRKWVLLICLIAWGGISNRDTVVGLAKKLLPVSIRQYVDKFSVMENWPVSVWVIGSLSILSGFILESAYRLYRIERNKAKQLEKEICSHLAPRLAIVYDSQDPSFRIEEREKFVARRLRVKVLNSSAKTIDDLKVNLIRLDPPSLDGVLPIPLLPTHRLKVTALNPNDHLMFDAFYKDSREDFIRLTHSVPTLESAPDITHFPAMPLRTAWIEATGRDCPKCEIKLSLYVTEDKLIGFTEIG